MKIRSADFEISAVKPAQWPVDGLPEVAFVGRSNVGKSSLLNRLLGRKSLARVSARPGKTQTINFFRINNNFRLVDLPGYGYAQVSKREREAFAKMMDTYLRHREPLVRIVHLIDIRHDPTNSDVEAHEWLLSLGVPLCVVATKMDKVPRTKINPALNTVRRGLQTPYPVLAVSSEKNQGIDALWDILLEDVAEESTSTPPTESSPSETLSAQPDGGIGDPHAEKDEDGAKRL